MIARIYRRNRGTSDYEFIITPQDAEARGGGEIEHNQIGGQIVDTAMKVHSALGPDLLESAYEACLQHELRRRKLRVEPQLALPLNYDGVKLDVGYRIDLLVERSVIVEVKAVEKRLPIHETQLLCYLRLSGCRLGLLINFNVMQLKDGIKRIVHNL